MTAGQLAPLWLLLMQLACWGPSPSSAMVVGGGFPSPPSFAVGTHTIRIADDSYIRGYKRFVSGRPVWHYLGIPYAKPPVGRLRFRAPQPPDGPVGGRTFEMPRDVFHKPRSCYFWPMAAAEYEKVNGALMMWWNNTEMSEDCLFLNVWTPTVSTVDKKAVMVWIFGGGFYGGSASLEVYDGAVLSSKGDVIVASMQYRTGALGFMHLDDEESPGNMGLLDQQMAMKWIWTNIEKFGGDPSCITIFGESAGAVSVSYHVLSRVSNGYFSRAIMNSGTALAWWGYEDRAEGRAKAEHLARQVGCSVDPANRKRTVECMRNVNVEKVQTETTNTYYWMNYKRSEEYKKLWSGANNKEGSFLFFDVPFKPVYGTAFIPEKPEVTIRKGNFNKTDILLGVVKDEGTFWIMYALSTLFLRNNSWYLPQGWNSPLPANATGVTEEDPFERVPLNFLPTQFLSSLHAESVAFEYQVPSKRYGFSSWSAEQVLNAYNDMTGDWTFKCPVVDFADMYLSVLGPNATANVWMFSFEHHTENLPLPNWTGVMHGYDIEYVFGMPFNANFSDKFYAHTRAEATLSEDMIRFWSNFAKTGNPNKMNASSSGPDATWPPYQSSNRSNIILEVSSGSSYRLGQNLRGRECNFWQYRMSQMSNYIRRSDVKCPENPDPVPSKAVAPRSSGISLLLAALLSCLTGLGLLPGRGV